MSKAARRIILLWHRWLGLAAVPFVLLLAITGVLLERTDALDLDTSSRISQVSSIFSAARRRFCYKNHEVVAYMERRIWHTRWVNRNRGAFGSFLTVD